MTILSAKFRVFRGHLKIRELRQAQPDRRLRGKS